MNKDCLWGLEPKDRYCGFCTVVCSARPLEQTVEQCRSTTIILPLPVKDTAENNEREDFEKRMILEYKELQERTDKLNAFLNYDENADKRKNVCVGQLELMHKQLDAMKAYLDALNARLQIRGIYYNGYDINVLNGWHKFSEELPPFGVEVLAFHHKWIDEDFNPRGFRIGFLQDNLAKDAEYCKYDFVSAYWWNYQDCYMTISKAEIEEHEEEYSNEIKETIIPEYWIELPDFKV